MIPVFLIVPRGEEGTPGEVGDFVMEIAGPFKPFRCLHKEVILQIFFGKSKLAFLISPPKRGFVFEG
jgi:hypothetical protein